jgi:hypothetical protein
VTTNTTSDAIPYGFCHCGCGQKTKLERQNNKKKGVIKGQPRLFLMGHQFRMKKMQPLAERFWSHVAIGASDECWEWQASRSCYGYGQFEINDHNYPASRVAWILTNGPVPDGLDILHSCNNPPCCNPAHLRPGTVSDNMQDSIRAGTHYRFTYKRGSEHHNAKLTENDVRQIRILFAKGNVTKVQLGRDFGVTPENIAFIVNRKHWSHIL